MFLALAPRYGPHRDELYFAAAGDRLAWGYPDQGWVTPALARLSTELVGHDLLALRAAPALLMLAQTLIAAHGARVLGGTAAVDMVVWAAVLVLVAQALLRDQPRLWLAAGVVAGLGLSNKFTVALLLGALFVAALASPPARRQLGMLWPWIGGIVAVAIWLPNLLWQAQHSWPQFVLADDIASEFGGIHGRVALLSELVVMYSALLLVVWAAGLVALFRRDDWAAARVVPLTFAVALCTLLVTGGKGYYLAGAVVPLLAVGVRHDLPTVEHPPLRSGRHRPRRERGVRVADGGPDAPGRDVRRQHLAPRRRRSGRDDRVARLRRTGARCARRAAGRRSGETPSCSPPTTPRPAPSGGTTSTSASTPGTTATATGAHLRPMRDRGSWSATTR